MGVLASAGGGGLVVPGSEIGGAMAEVVDWWDAVEQFVFSFRQFQGHLLRERQQPMQDVELVRKGGRKGQHPSRKSRRRSGQGRR